MLENKRNYLANTKDSARGVINTVLDFQELDDLGIYLGIPLFHKRVTRSTFHLVIDKVQTRLNGFDAKLLSLARRVTLTKSVLLAIPEYFMQSKMILISVCEKIKQVVRNFM